jgi:uncharacterized protein YceH (UPF0502 family)
MTSSSPTYTYRFPENKEDTTTGNDSDSELQSELQALKDEVACLKTMINQQKAEYIESERDRVRREDRWQREHKTEIEMLEKDHEYQTAIASLKAESARKIEKIGYQTTIDTLKSKLDKPKRKKDELIKASLLVGTGFGLVLGVLGSLAVSILTEEPTGKPVARPPQRRIFFW